MPNPFAEDKCDECGKTLPEVSLYMPNFRVTFCSEQCANEFKEYCKQEGFIDG